MTEQELDVVDEEIVGFTEAPSATESRTLTEMGRELYAVDVDIARLERELAARQERRVALTQRELPDYMGKLRQDSIGLEEFGVDLVREKFYHANIKAEWPEEQREAAFDYLEQRGDGDLIKLEITLQFSRTARKLADWVLDQLKKLKPPKTLKGEIPAAAVRKTVPWNTLTAYVRGQLEAGRALDLEILGATVGNVVKIKQRKT